MPFSSAYIKESDIVIELEDNLKTIKTIKIKLQELGESL